LNQLQICRLKRMLLLLRYVSSNNSSHPQGYLRKVVAKKLAYVYDLPPTVLETDRRSSQLLWVRGLALPEFRATQCLVVWSPCLCGHEYGALVI